jgi:hypothetical protein
MYTAVRSVRRLHLRLILHWRGLGKNSQIVFNGQTQNVKWAFVAGRALKEDGKVKGVDVGQLIKAAQAATDHITPSIQP